MPKLYSLLFTHKYVISDHRSILANNNSNTKLLSSLRDFSENHSRIFCKSVFFFNQSLQLPACPWARANILADQQLFLSCEKIDVYVLSLWTTPPYLTDDVKILLISHCRQFHVREIRKIPRNTKNARIGR